jgi:iron complex transport system substrate-binding protein
MHVVRILLLIIFYGILPCANAAVVPLRIITLSGALSETVHALGFGSSIVAVDVTSEYPAYIKKLPRVSKNRSVSAESIISFAPDIVLAPDGDISKAIQQQLKSAGIKLVNIRQEYSIKGALQFIKSVGAALNVNDKASELAQNTAIQIQTTLDKIKTAGSSKIKVLFIYARGAGNMTVAGKGSSMDAIIQLSGAKNAIQEFTDFKAYNTESLVRANPDVILLFDFGLNSLGGKDGILKMPGVMLTNAGKHNRIIEVDGPLMINFSVRTAEAINDLHKKIFQ